MVQETAGPANNSMEPSGSQSSTMGHSTGIGHCGEYRQQISRPAAQGMAGPLRQ